MRSSVPLRDGAERKQHSPQGENGDLSFSMYFSKHCLVGNIQRKFLKVLLGNFYF